MTKRQLKRQRDKLKPWYKAQKKRSVKRWRKKVVKKRRAEWFAGKVCVRCGSGENLELDHIIPKPHRPNSDIWLWTPARRNEELKKCQCLCRSCHRKKSALERRKYEHGLNLYERHGCKCSICRAAHAASRRKSRARKKLIKSALTELGGVTLTLSL